MVSCDIFHPDRPYVLLVLNSDTDLSVLTSICGGPFSSVWNNADVVVAADGAANLIKKACLKNNVVYAPHYIIGDLDSLCSRDDFHASSSQIISLSSQDENDCSKCLSFLSSKYPNHHLLVIGVLGGRFDQICANLSFISQTSSFSSITCLSRGNFLQLLRPGHHTLVNNPWFGPHVGLLPLNGVSIVKSRGFHWDVDGVMKMNGLVSSSNKFKSSVVHVVVADNPIWFSVDCSLFDFL
ncbi:hypothetical protein RCL1_003490 [Eukaryota sp. TZLM3-RCL]